MIGKTADSEIINKDAVTYKSDIKYRKLRDLISFFSHLSSSRRKGRKRKDCLHKKEVICYCIILL